MDTRQAARILSQNEGHIWSAICNCARHYGVTLCEADEQDIFQTTMVNALAAFQGQAACWDAKRWESVPAYLRKIASNTTVDALRARKRTVDVDDAEAEACEAGADDSWLTQHSVDPEQVCLAVERAEQGIKAYLGLSKGERKTVDAALESEESAPAKLGVKPGAYRVRKCRAVAKLTAALK